MLSICSGCFDRMSTCVGFFSRWWFHVLVVLGHEPCFDGFQFFVVFHESLFFMVPLAHVACVVFWL